MSDREEVLGIVRQLNIIDDTLFQKMAEDIGFCEEMISIIMGQNIYVKKVVPQNSIKNLQGRSVVLDAPCVTANITEPGTKFEKVPDVTGIYISKFDMFHSGKTIYHIDRVIRETGEIQENGLQEIYVNTKIDDGSDVAELMRIFKESDAYDFKKFPKVSGRKKQFKESEGGDEAMCDLVENYAKKKAEEAAIAKEKDNALRFFQNGASYELVRASIVLLSDEELHTIYQEAVGK